jgi:hypothetical protein
MSESDDLFTETAEFEDDAAYDWWRNAHPGGFVMALSAKKPPMLHRATCSDIDRDRHRGRLKAKGARQLCAELKSALRAWLARETETGGKLLDRCPKCAP